MKLVNRITTRHDKEIFNEYEFKCIYFWMEPNEKENKIGNYVIMQAV